MDLGRYGDKPFLLLLEAFVLDAIGELPEETERMAKAVSHKLFGKGDWRRRLREQVGFPKELSQQVSDLWKENQVIAKEKGATLLAPDFAQALVEANFAEIIEMAVEDIEAEDPKEEG